MNVKKIMLLVGALVIAAVTAIMAKNMFAGAGAEQAQAAAAVPAQPVGPKVLVARKDHWTKFVAASQARKAPCIVSVDLTTATASEPGCKPSSWAASVLIDETTRRWDPHWSSVWLITVSPVTLGKASPGRGP